LHVTMLWVRAWSPLLKAKAFSSFQGRFPDVFFFLGGPGAGKGVQCQLLATSLGLKFFSVGDLLREEMRKIKEGKSTFTHALLLEKALTTGSILPGFITAELILSQIARDSSPSSLITGTSRFQQTWLIDGFPRNMDNIKSYNDLVDHHIFHHESPFLLLFPGWQGQGCYCPSL